MRILGLDHILLAMPPGGEEAALGFYAGLLGLLGLEPFGNRLEFIQSGHGFSEHGPRRRS